MPDFSFMMFNLFNYFIPSTISSNSFEVGDTVTLNCRGQNLKISGNGIEKPFTTTPATVVVDKPGSYTVTQTPMNGGDLLIETFFVSVPAYESDLTKEVDSLPLVDVENKVKIEYKDLLFYFAIALVALMFVEWALQSKKNY
jgi:hypothetical protein